MRRIALVVVACHLALALPAAARPRRDKPGGAACGLRSLPLAVGNTWTYKQAALEVTVKVVAVAPGKNAAGAAITEIKVEETFADRTLPQTWTCTPKEGLTLPPDSFLFSGEPGGGVGATFTVTSHAEVTYPAEAALVAGYAWIEKVHADVGRADVGKAGAQHPAAKIEVERHASVQPGEAIELELGTLVAQKIGFELRGRGIVGEEKLELPVKRPGAIFYVKGLGVIKIDDAFDRTWTLVSTSLPLPKK